MANRAKPKKKATPKAKARVVKKMDKLAAKARAKAAKKPRRDRRGGNSGDHSVPDEVYERHLSKIDSTAHAMDKAKVEYDQAKGVHQSAYKAAKEDGCDIDSIRIARKLDGQDHGATVITYANVARVLNLMDSPLGSKQLDLFGAIVQPAPKVDANLQGQQAGKNAEPAENNPFTPNTDDFVSWAEGWATGQSMNMDEFAGKH